MRIRVMGKLYKLVIVAKNVAFATRRDKDGSETRMSRSDDGLTEAPQFSKKRIFLRDVKPNTKRQLENQIHEFTHAADWSKDEEWVSQFGNDLANFLLKMGWRCTEPPEIEVTSDPETLPG